jgi:hypothetical protein
VVTTAADVVDPGDGESDADPTGDNPDGNEEIVFATCGSPSPSFNDVGLSSPFFPEIEWLAEVEVTGGFDDGGYHPSAPVSRQAMAAFMFRLADGPALTSPSPDARLAHPGPAMPPPPHNWENTP